MSVIYSPSRDYTARFTNGDHVQFDDPGDAADYADMMNRDYRQFGAVADWVVRPAAGVFL